MLPPPKNRARRHSVSAESDRSPSTAFKPKIIPKTHAQLERIRGAMHQCILFSSLDKDQLSALIDSMSELTVTAGSDVIKQNELGDYFYVIDSGVYHVFKNVSAATDDENDSVREVKVYEYNNRGSFGELALMYGCPRAATVRAVTSGVLWRVDRETFHHIIIASTARKRQIFESALERVPILSNLSKQERAQVADTLETMTLHRGDTVIKQGDIGESMYFIIKGTARATQTVDGVEVEVGRMNDGNYFGERSLLTQEPRAASVVVDSETLECAVMDRSAVERLLGSVKEIMRRQISEYKTANKQNNLT